MQKLMNTRKNILKYFSKILSLKKVSDSSKNKVHSGF